METRFFITSAPSLTFVIECCLMEFQLTVVVLLFSWEHSYKTLRSYWVVLFLKINSDISLDIMKKEYMSIIINSLNHLNPLVSDPRQFWKLLYDLRNTQTWNQAFFLLELCLCAPYSNVVKTDWQNRLNEENLTHLLWVKVDRPTLEKFCVNHRGKAVTLWCNDRNHRMHQPQCKACKKREIKQTETELLNFNLTSTYEDSDSSNDNSNVDFN